MNILHTESSMNWGGQEYRTLLEHKYLNERDMKSWIMCHPESALYKKATEHGCSNLVPMDLSKAWNLHISYKVLIFCIKQKIDIINSHGSKDSTLCIIAYLYGFTLMRSRQISSIIKRRFSYQHTCTHIIAAAHTIKHVLTSAGVDRDRITVIGEGVDLNEYNPDLESDHLRHEFNINHSEIIVSNIGMIRGDKGQKYYLEAAQLILNKYDDVKFFLIGEGTREGKTLEKELRKIVQDTDLSDRFIMTGYRNDVASFIHLSDVIVVASTAVEAQSRIVPQSFATKRAVVSTNTGGLTELVKNEVNGLVVPSRNANELGNAIIRLIEDENLRARLAENGFMFANANLSFDKMMGKTIHLYRRFVNAEGARI
jgi:glycosyltransferase involved in cell wall biosynthesis